MIVSAAVLVLGVPVGLVAELVGDSGRGWPTRENRRDPAPGASAAAAAAKVEHPAPEVARQRGSAERRRPVGRQRVRVYLAGRAADPYRRLRPRRRGGRRCSRVKSVPGVSKKVLGVKVDVELARENIIEFINIS